MFTNLKDAVNWIESQVKFKPKADLNRMKQAQAMLNYPDQAYQIIHVGGTNGKGSVCSYLAHILTKHYKVGVFTSPYIVKFNERIKINLDMISDQDLLFEINDIKTFNNAFTLSYGEPLSFFELITLIALKYFKKQQVDVVILEVGIGGLLDSTNIVNADLAIITSIGYDHMQQLGDTLELIAFNKLGIVKENTPLITAVDKALYPQFIKHTTNTNSKVLFIDDENIQITNDNPLEFQYEYHTYKPQLLGLHQAKNAALAIAAVNYLFPKIPIKDIKAGILNTTWPGRFEVMLENPLVILDGAHNTHGIDALIKTVESYYQDRNVHILFCAMADKDTKHMLQSLSQVAKTMHLTHFDYKRVLDLPSLLEQTPHKEKYAHEDPFKAVDMLIDRYQADVIIITGSLYFVSLVRPYLIDKSSI